MCAQKTARADARFEFPERLAQEVAAHAHPDPRVVARGLDPIDVAHREHHRTLPGRDDEPFLARTRSRCLHIPLIHATALVVSVAREGRVNPWLFENHPMMDPPPPDGYMWSLPLLYLVFAIVIALLFLPTRWYAARRIGHRHGWMRYL